MRRFGRLFLATLVVACVSSVLPGAASAADPNELADLLKASDSSGTDAAKVEALLDVLRDAEKRQAQKRSSGKSATPAPPLESGAGDAAPAVALGHQAGPAAAAADAPEGDEESDAEDDTPKQVIRAGCMYSDAKLIWEKVPGACSR